MQYNFFSVEQYMREHQREILAAAARARRAQGARRSPSAPSAAGSATQRATRQPALLALAIAGLGRGLVNVGHGLERLASRGPKDGRFCDDQPTAAGG